VIPVVDHEGVMVAPLMPRGDMRVPLGPRLRDGPRVRSRVW